MTNPKRLEYIKTMPTVLRKDGFEFVIRTHDHTPAHVHVFKSGEVLINLGYNELPSVRENRGMSKKDVRKALDIATDEQTYLLARWCEIHHDIDEWCQNNEGENGDEEDNEENE